MLQGLGTSAGGVAPQPIEETAPSPPSAKLARESTTSFRDQDRPQREQTMDAICIRTASKNPNFIEQKAGPSEPAEGERKGTTRGIASMFASHGAHRAPLRVRLRPARKARADQRTQVYGSETLPPRSTHPGPRIGGPATPIDAPR